MYGSECAPSLMASDAMEVKEKFANSFGKPDRQLRCAFSLSQVFSRELKDYVYSKCYRELK